MPVLNKQLKGSDLCNYDCLESTSIIHPETNTSQILLPDSADTLDSWLGGGGFTAYNNLLEWLQHNYTLEDYSLPIATNNVLGGVKIGQYLNITNEGVVSVDISSLNIPSVTVATSDTTGTLKLGNRTNLNRAFNSDTAITDVNPYYLPLRLDSNGRAGIAIEQSLFTSTQSDWNTTNINAASYIKNKPALSTVATSGNYNDLSNKPIITTYSEFTGSDAGLVPQSTSADQNKYLKGNGSWSTISYNELTDLPDFAAFMKYKGAVSTYSALEAIENPEVGDVYNVQASGMNYAWDGDIWDALGSGINIDTLSNSDHSNTKSYVIKGPGTNTDVYLKGDGTWHSVEPNYKYVVDNSDLVTDEALIVNCLRAGKLFTLIINWNSTAETLQTYITALVSYVDSQFSNTPPPYYIQLRGNSASVLRPTLNFNNKQIYATEGTVSDTPTSSYLCSLGNGGYIYEIHITDIVTIFSRGNTTN